MKEENESLKGRRIAAHVCRMLVEYRTLNKRIWNLDSFLKDHPDTEESHEQELQLAAMRLYAYHLCKRIRMNGIEDPLKSIDSQDDPVLDVEIPFGAKDSELEEVFYSIPNGFHAEIEDDKVVIKKGEKKPCMIQWKGDNLKEVIDFTGKDKNFEKWFKSFEEYEKYVGDHNGIFKLFNEDGSHYEVPVGAWIVKTPDGYNIASKAVLKQKSAVEWSEEDQAHLESIDESLFMFESGRHENVVEGTEDDRNWLKSLKSRVQPKQEWSEEDEDNFKHLMDEVVCLGNSRNSANRLHYDRLIKFLYELKNLAQPREEWRDKDERMLDRLIAYFEKRVAFTDDDNPRYANWLKSLRPQSTWKPSDEQIKVLHDVAAYIDNSIYPNQKDILVNLYLQLNKLREI